MVSIVGLAVVVVVVGSVVVIALVVAALMTCIVVELTTGTVRFSACVVLTKTPMGAIFPQHFSL